MDTYSLSALFRQLGLNDTPAAIDAFVSQHNLPEGKPLYKADYWNPAQAEFLQQALAEDSDWTEVVDTLASRLEADN